MYCRESVERMMTMKKTILVIIAMVLALTLCSCAAAKAPQEDFEFIGDKGGSFIYSSELGELSWKESWRGGTLSLNDHVVLIIKGKSGQVMLPDGRDMTVTLDGQDKVQMVSVRPSVEVRAVDHVLIRGLVQVHHLALKKAQTASAKNAIWMLIFLVIGGLLLFFTHKLTEIITARKFVSDKYERNLILILRIVGGILVVIPLLFLIITAGKLR